MYSKPVSGLARIARISGNTRMASGGLCRQTSLKKKIHQTICPCSSSIRAQGMSSASLCRRVDCDASHCAQMGRVAGTSFGDRVPSEDLIEDYGAECCGAYSAH